MKLPDEVSLSAFVDAGAPVTTPLDERAPRWGVRGDMLGDQRLLAPVARPDPGDWAHPDIGWGVVLPDDDDLSVADRVAGADAPAAIRRLLAAREGAPVLRYRAEVGTDRLLRYLPDGRRQALEIGISVFGVAPARIPRFLLLVGGPDVLPWRLQFALNRRHLVGRLALSGPGLERYVDCLLSGWKDTLPDPTQALVWSTTHDAMTQTMDVTVATQVDSALSGDEEIAVHRLTASGATHAALADALVAQRPALVVTTSHGLTAPLNDGEAMRAVLGVPVDQNLAPLDLAAGGLLGGWQPGGAIWLAQACCSAGSNLGTSYAGLLPEGTLPHRVVTAVSALGPQIAPLPQALLEADPPLAGFLGHVEPTFDWTLAVPDTRQHVVTPLVHALYPRLFLREPVGLALADYYAGVGVLYGKLSDARTQADALVAGARERATYYKLTALDRESLVLLGDPTVTVPPLPSQRQTP